MELWLDLGENSDLDVLDKELITFWPDETDSKFRSAFYICSEKIQLMENVYLDLSLEETWDHPDTKGWRTLFKQWVQSSYVHKHGDTYGSRFQFFWKRKFTREFVCITNQKPGEINSYPIIKLRENISFAFLMYLELH